MVLHGMLDPVPHRTLSLDPGPHVSLYDGETYSGCQVSFETNDELLSSARVPDLIAAVGTPLYGLGWRIDNTVGADGPGTTLFAIRRGAVFCLIYEAQPAYLDDAGEIISSDTLTITAQCRLD